MREHIRAALTSPLCDAIMHFNGRVIHVEQFTCAQVLNFRKSRVGLCRCFELNLKSRLSRIATFSRDPVSVRYFKSVGSLIRVKSITFKMSKISQMFKVSSSSSRPSSGSSSRSKHRSRSSPSPQEAINRLRETEAMLTKKQEYLETRIEQEIMIAKKNGTKNKRGM